jgi:hypothetical protein
MKASTRALAFWVGLFLFSLYLLSFSGKLHVMDEFVGYAAGNNLVQHGRADVNQFIWTNHWHSTPPGVWGVDGNLYTKKAPGISLAAAPLIWLGHTLPGLNAVHVSLLSSMIVTALTGSLLFIWLVELDFSRFTATLIALAYGLATIAWVYARLLWEHSLIAFVFLAVMWTLRRAVYDLRTRRRWPWILATGLAMAVGLVMRFELAPAVALIGLYLLWEAINSQDGKLLQPSNDHADVSRLTYHVPGRGLPVGPFTLNLPALLRLFSLYLGPSALAGLGLLYFNYIRFGSIVETGYNREILFSRPWVGAYGLLFSPSTGLFIYVPLMLLLFLGLRPAWRRLPHPYYLLIIILTVFYWLFYGSWFSWGSTWVWGPRFLLHTLPLMMLFVAEPVEWLKWQKLTSPALRVLAWGGLALLIALGLAINFLGVVVDLNEYFLRLGRNDNFVFNWAAFPPLGHWQILREGLVDLIWLQPQPQSFEIEWTVLAPALILLLLATGGLIGVYTSRDRRRFFERPLMLIVMLALAIGLTFGMMRATAAVAVQNDPQAWADLPVLQTLADSARPGDALHIPMPPFGDVLEISTLVMAYLDEPLPTYAWIESEPRAIQPEERERIWQATQAEASRVWLFERWLTPEDRLSLTAARLGQVAFTLEERWFDQSGKLTLYALADPEEPAQAIPLDVPFEGGLNLVDFSVEDSPVGPGEVVKVRLTWHASEIDGATAASMPVGGVVVGFLHLLAGEAGAENVAQQDRVLLDLRRPEWSPLLPGQTVPQGYGLRLPEDLPPGSYPLIAGLYLAETGQRLRRAGGSPDDFIYLTNILVE